MSPCVSTCGVSTNGTTQQPESTASGINSNMAAFTFLAKSHPGDMCNRNGLPLTPNSIAIVGQSQFLRTLSHPHLCEYLDVIRGKHDRAIVVSEYRGNPLSDFGDVFDAPFVRRLVYQVASALDYLKGMDLVCHNLEPANLLLDEHNNIRLFNYGLFYMTRNGEYVNFPIGNARYMAPERILGSSGNVKSDTWSLGILAAELLFQCTFWPTLNLSQILRKVMSLINTKNVLEKIARENNCLEMYETMDQQLRTLIETCLSISPHDRPTPGDILQSAYFKDDLTDVQFTKGPPADALLLRCPLKHIYHWWQLAGGDVPGELKKAGLIRSEAPILKMPILVLLDGPTIGPSRGQSFMLDNRVVKLSLTNLAERLSRVRSAAFYPLLHSPANSLNNNRNNAHTTDMQRLPLVIRERDTEYQFHRVVLFHRLLQGYPFTREMIVAEAQTDIPPLLRGHIWSCVLGVLENGSYARIDKDTATPTDRQIEVDIPRCHQYDELLSAPEGHHKLKRLLKAWVTSHPQYVYWQGLDSLTAPFLYLNYCNEERAFLSLYKFIPKYLHWFFLKDNSAIIKEYLSKFSQLTAFHEPTLAKHLRDISFIPELFAIPWFLTMFSHVFPLHKILHLWDKLILGDSSYPLYVGIAILRQLKATLLASGFNECILLFSDLPDIVMETCVVASQQMYLASPKSISYRKHVQPDAEQTQRPDEFDITDIELRDLQDEISPRISARDLTDLVRNQPDSVFVCDLRSPSEYRRAHLATASSINIPFTSVMLGDIRLETLQIPELEQRMAGRIVVVVSCVPENDIFFSKFLVDCGVAQVCTLQKGFNILHSVVPNILISSAI